jgi:hypothetical protein
MTAMRKRKETLFTLLVLLALPFFQESLFAQGLLDGLAKPLQGRSMRATSTFRKGADGKYDPNAEPLSNKDSETRTTIGERSRFSIRNSRSRPSK